MFALLGLLLYCMEVSPVQRGEVAVRGPWRPALPAPTSTFRLQLSWEVGPRLTGPAASSLGSKSGSAVGPSAFVVLMPDLQQALQLWFGEINDMLIT